MNPKSFGMSHTQDILLNVNYITITTTYMYTPYTNACTVCLLGDYNSE